MLPPVLIVEVQILIMDMDMHIRAMDITIGLINVQIVVT